MIPSGNEDNDLMQGSFGDLLDPILNEMSWNMQYELFTFGSRCGFTSVRWANIAERLQEVLL